jgi:hypothetical protein
VNMQKGGKRAGKKARAPACHGALEKPIQVSVAPRPRGCGHVTATANGAGPQSWETDEGVLMSRR